MKIPCAALAALLSAVAVVSSTAPAQSYQFASKSVGVSLSDPSKSDPPAVPAAQPSAVPAISNQFAAEYNYGPYSRSAFAPKSAASQSPFSAYQPYQPNNQQYSFGPYQQQQQQYYPGAGYPAAAPGSYPTPYSAYPFAALGGPYGSYPSAYPSYYGQFGSPSSYGSHQFASPAPTTYAALPPAYHHQQLRSNHYNPAVAVDGNQLPSLQQYPSFYHNSPASAAAADPAKVSSEKK